MQREKADAAHGSLYHVYDGAWKDDCARSAMWVEIGQGAPGGLGFEQGGSGVRATGADACPDPSDGVEAAEGYLWRDAAASIGQGVVGV